jgi:tRNA-2-methylthio-N6-dimethylallyladenosine synthase
MSKTLDKTIDESRQGEAFFSADTLRTKSTKKLYLESYGCAMNFADSEVVASVLIGNGYSTTQDETEADLVLINTCAVRDNAEQRVRKRLTEFRKQKKEKPWLIVGVLGCMAERIKSQLLEEEKLVDLVVGPDAYRDLPNLVQTVSGGQKAVNVLLSRDETYADITPIRLDQNGVSAFVSITRGCDNMCSFCVVPFTRGRERSRDYKSIVNEVKGLIDKGYKEVTLLGQNVNSYRWNKSKTGEIENPNDEIVNFARLLEKVAQVDATLRVRYSTSHPKDMGDDVLEVMAKYDNICKHVHLPVQSGSSKVLNDMNRGYTKEWYMNRIEAIRRILPEASITTDIITGFCGETEDDHQQTLQLMDEVKFHHAYMYKYSERPKTLAERKFTDDVPEEVKQRRLNEIIDKQHLHSSFRNQEALHQEFEILVESISKKSENEMAGRNSQNQLIVFPRKSAIKGQLLRTRVVDFTKATLIGELI